MGRSATELRKSEPLQGSMVRVLVGSLEERRGNELLFALNVYSQLKGKCYCYKKDL